MDGGILRYLSYFPESTLIGNLLLKESPRRLLCVHPFALLFFVSCHSATAALAHCQRRVCVCAGESSLGLGK
jgi:hypothetical protein